MKQDGGDKKTIDENSQEITGEVLEIFENDLKCNVDVLNITQALAGMTVGNSSQGQSLWGNKVRAIGPNQNQLPWVQRNDQNKGNGPGKGGY